MPNEYVVFKVLLQILRGAVRGHSAIVICPASPGELQPEACLAWPPATCRFSPSRHAVALRGVSGMIFYVQKHLEQKLLPLHRGSFWEF